MLNEIYEFHMLLNFKDNANNLFFNLEDSLSGIGRGLTILARGFLFDDEVKNWDKETRIKCCDAFLNRWFRGETIPVELYNSLNDSQKDKFDSFLIKKKTKKGEVYYETFSTYIDSLKEENDKYVNKNIKNLVLNEKSEDASNDNNNSKQKFYTLKIKKEIEQLEKDIKESKKSKKETGKIELTLKKKKELYKTLEPEYNEYKKRYKIRIAYAYSSALKKDLITNANNGENSRNSISTEMIIADALFQGPLKNQKLVAKKSVFDDDVFYTKSINKTTKVKTEKQSGNPAKMTIFSAIVLYLQSKEYNDSEQLWYPIKKVDLADLCNVSASNIRKTISNYYYNNGNKVKLRIIKTSVVGNNRSKMLINQNLLQDYDFKLLNYYDEVGPEYISIEDKHLTDSKEINKLKKKKQK